MMIGQCFDLIPDLRVTHAIQLRWSQPSVSTPLDHCRPRDSGALSSSPLASAMSLIDGTGRHIDDKPDAEIAGYGP